MNPTTQSDDRSDFWQHQVDAWKLSGLSGAKFCEANELIYHRFVYWRQKFTPLHSQQSAPQSSGGFVSVTYPPGDEAGLSLSLPNGLVIRGIGAGNIAVVRQLLDTL
jgi:hypothetical protein